MNPIHIQTLATGFAVMGVVIGLPSFMVLLLYAVNVIRNHLKTGASVGSDFGKNPDALLLMVKGMAETIAALSRAFGAMGQFLLGGLAIIACVGLFLAVTCWFTGRGLHTHANWARVSAFILLVLALLPSLVLVLSSHNLGRLVMLVIVTLCLFGLHALWIGYPPQAL